MTLKSFIEGGYDVPDGKILVCVKSIGGRKKCMRKFALPFRVTYYHDDIAISLGSAQDTSAD